MVLVHATFADEGSNWVTLAPLLANNGYCVYGFNYGETSKYGAALQPPRRTHSPDDHDGLVRTPGRGHPSFGCSEKCEEAAHTVDCKNASG